MDATLEAAAKEYIARAEHKSRPAGFKDRDRQWRPYLNEMRKCCSTIHYPSRHYSSSLYKHCLTYRHIANLFHVDVRALRTEVARLLRERNIATSHDWMTRG